MKNDLTCGVVRDLLPSYVDGLLCEESRQAVDRHLADCPRCAAALSAMEPPETPPPAETPEVDYLRRVITRNRWKIAAAAAAAGILVVAAFLYQMLERGVPLNHETVAITEQNFVPAEEDSDCLGMLSLFLTSTDSGRAFHSWRVATEETGVSYITAREVLASPLHPSGSGGMDIPVSNLVREIWLGSPGGRLLWQDGVLISPLALELMDAKAPCCGDPAAIERLAEVLHLRERLGSYTLSLQTDKHPYGCTLEFANRLNDAQLNMVTCFNLLSLALVDNLEASRFAHPAPEDATDPTKKVTAGMLLDGVNETVLPALVEEYNAAHGTGWEARASIKDYAASPAELQRLLLILDSFYQTELGV